MCVCSGGVSCTALILEPQASFMVQFPVVGVASRWNYNGELQCFLWCFHDVSSIYHVLVSIKK